VDKSDLIAANVFLSAVLIVIFLKTTWLILGIVYSITVFADENQPSARDHC